MVHRVADLLHVQAHDAKRLRNVLNDFLVPRRDERPDVFDRVPHDRRQIDLPRAQLLIELPKSEKVMLMVVTHSIELAQLLDRQMTFEEGRLQ